MNLNENYYPCFLGNGLDALLVGYSGSMVPDKTGVDYCNWYKSDRYYPEQKLVKVAGRFPEGKTLEHAEGSGWFEIAPLGRTWYEVYLNGAPLEIQTSDQRFEPQKGLLHTQLDFGPIQAQVTTFLHAHESVLIERYEFSAEVEFRAWMGPGVWVEDDWHTTPFLDVEMDPASTGGSYNLGETQGRYHLQTEPAPSQEMLRENARGLVTRGKVITKYFSILDNRQGIFDAGRFQKMIAPGYDVLYQGHIQFWQEYFFHSSIQIPDQQFQDFYDASLYHFKAAQSRTSGGLPVNNLRRTWSSHVFWDSYFIQRALLESNHLNESLEACRFFQRTIEHARKHARDEFGCNGLKWDWEITHDGRKAYGTLLHMKYQAHNNGSYSNEIWQHYQFTQDRAFLQDFLPILEGLAIFFMECIVEKTERGWEIGPLVGMDERPIRVRNEGISLGATIVILEHYADAVRLLAEENDFSHRCDEVAAGLRKTLDLLFNGKYFVASEGSDKMGMGHVYPMRVTPFTDPRAVLTTQALVEEQKQQMLGNDNYYNFPWAHGTLGMILAHQGNGEAAWASIQHTRPTICQFGGMAEVMEKREWNMQYFGTAQAAVVTAIHNLMLQSVDEVVSLFPALPADWQTCSFTRLMALGLEVSASFDHGRITAEVKNIAPLALDRTIIFGAQMQSIHLEPGQTYALQSPQ
jgi:hypothetical protein